MNFGGMNPAPLVAVDPTPGGDPWLASTPKRLPKK
jgi:hypothetical protein